MCAASKQVDAAHNIFKYILHFAFRQYMQQLLKANPAFLTK
jgi:hypothetical protein